MVDSAYFKTLLHGTQSKFGEGKADPLQSDLSQQAAILERAIARAKDFGTDKVRIFSFLRVADPDTVFDRVARELERTAQIARREAIRLVLENGPEQAKLHILSRIKGFVTDCSADGASNPLALRAGRQQASSGANGPAD